MIALIFPEVTHGMELHGDWPPKGSRVIETCAHANGVCQYMQSLSMERFSLLPQLHGEEEKDVVGMNLSVSSFLLLRSTESRS